MSIIQRVPWTVQPQYPVAVNLSVAAAGNAPIWPITTGGGSVSGATGARGVGIAGVGITNPRGLLSLRALNNDFTLIVVASGGTAASNENWLGCDTGSGRIWQFRLGATGTVEFIRFNTAVGAFTAASGVISLTRPYVAIGTSSGASVAAYGGNIAGAQAVSGTNTITGTPLAHTESFPIYIGSRDAVPNNTFTGTLYSYFVLPFAISAKEAAKYIENPWQLFSKTRRIWVPGAGVTFESASNSSYQAASSTYSWSHTCTGTSRFLSVDVSLLSPGQTVTGITYNGVALSFIGGQSTVTSFGRVEQWGLVAPASGANTIAVTLSGVIASVGTAASYAGVHQTTPTEAFNSAQATNVGAADATVSVTTVADNCRVHAAVATGDMSVTAGQTSRNNVTGAGGSGANEDNGAPKTPAGSVTMSYTGVGAAMTWAIAGYAIRPLAASGASGTLTTTTSLTAAIQAAQAATASVAAAIQIDRTASATVDAAIQIARTAQATLDAAIQAALSGTATVGAAIQAPLTGSASLDAAIQHALTATTTLGAAVQATLTASATLTAYIQAGTTAIATVDAAVQAAQSASATLGAAIVVASSASASLGAAIMVQVSISTALSAAVQAGGSAAATLSAYIQSVGALSDAEFRELYTWVSELRLIHGLVSGSPLSVTPTARTAGTISQTIGEAGTTVTVTRI